MGNKQDPIRSALLSLQEAIASGRLLGTSTTFGSEDDLNAVLDSRDRDPNFSDEWMRVHMELAATKKTSSTWQKYASLADGIRESAFFAVGNATDHHEIASYVSDDFDLFASSLALGYSDAWLNGLWSQYREQAIGLPPVEPKAGDLLTLLGDLGAAPN